MKLYWLSIVAFGLFSGRFVYADDTEIYRNTNARINPNVIFIIDTSGSMAYEAADNTPPETGELDRLDIVKNSAVSAISNLDTSLPINISVMRFDDRYSASSDSQGGFVLQPFTPTDSSSNKSLLEDKIKSMTLSNIGGGTPITESLYEAYLYMTGQAAVYGKPVKAPIAKAGDCKTRDKRGKCIDNYTSDEQTYFDGIATYYDSRPGISYTTRDTTYFGSAESSFVSGGTTYKSPVEATCQKNHIVIFTDGAPSSDTDANDEVQALIKNKSIPNELDKSCSGDGGCTVAFSYWLQNTDHFTDADLLDKVDPNASEIAQPIYVHTVGGFSGISEAGKTYLSNIAKYGHPLTSDNLNADGTSKHYYSADNETELTKALSKVFGGIANSAGNFAAPVVAVNAFNSLEHRDELYYSVFKPTEAPGWSGNIKRYKMNSSGAILDSNDNQAIDSQTGFFKDSAKSFWTIGDPDGAKVESGGMANRLPAGRNVYTALSGFGSIISTANRIHEDNSSITAAMLDDLLPSGTTVDSTTRIEILQWARGIDPRTGLARKTLADPLHGNPLLISYRDSSNSISDVLYTGTNVGYLHAFNTDINSPGELWAFMPKELLPNLGVYASGAGSVVKAYGIDGQLSTYHIDKNNDNVVDSGDTMYLTAGMRRGGSSYYLFDISSKSAPKFVNRISSGTTGFEELGQTWSRMIPADVMWKGKVTPVFFFGGGYDTDEDKATSRITHDKGNAIYMVKATSDSNGNTFDLLWKVSGHNLSSTSLYESDMKSSFAGDLSLVDNDGNGTVDLIYAADVGGRMWRFDIDKANTSASSFAQGGVIADFNDGSTAGDVRFYTQPDVVYTEFGKFEIPDPSDPTKTTVVIKSRYQITIGSGFRAGPLSTAVTDRVFVINDFDTLVPPTSYTTKSLSDLADYNSFSSATNDQILNGFYYTLPYNGEKVLSTTLTVNDVIYVPTFRPSDSTIEIGCEPDTGVARVLMIAPLSNGTTERQITSQDLEQGGIVPKPILVFPPSDPTTNEPSQPVIAIGTEVLAASGSFNAFQKTYWRKN